jgi:hypothetical protein
MSLRLCTVCQGSGTYWSEGMLLDHTCTEGIICGDCNGHGVVADSFEEFDAIDYAIDYMGFHGFNSDNKEEFRAELKRLVAERMEGKLKGKIE